MDLAALEEEARGLLPGPTYDYLAGGAGDEVSLRDAVAAWDRVRLRPRVLRDVSTVDTSTTLLGTPVPSPVMVAPTAFHRLAHDGGEEETARGAAAAEALMVLATRATSPPEAVAAVAPEAPRWYQVYVLQERDHTAHMVERAAAAGYPRSCSPATRRFLGVGCATYAMPSCSRPTSARRPSSRAPRSEAWSIRTRVSPSSASGGCTS